MDLYHYSMHRQVALHHWAHLNFTHYYVVMVVVLVVVVVTVVLSLPSSSMLLLLLVSSSASFYVHTCGGSGGGSGSHAGVCVASCYQATFLMIGLMSFPSDTIVMA